MAKLSAKNRIFSDLNVHLNIIQYWGLDFKSYLSFKNPDDENSWDNKRLKP